MTTECVHCKKPLTPRQILGKGKFCSRKCYALGGAPRGFSKRGINKQCVVCGNSFYTPQIHNDALYCSLKCKGIGSRMPYIPCPICTTPFKPLLGNNGIPAKTCSASCGSMLRKTGETIPCVVCSTPLYKKKSSKTKCCSTACSNAWQGRNKKTYTCQTCSNTFTKSASHEKFGTIKYCSVNCCNTNPEFLANLTQLRIAQSKNKDPNNLEKLGYKLLQEFGHAYIPQYTINNKFTVDAYIPTLNTVIQFDGDYWHGNPIKFKSTDKRQSKRMALDISQDAYLRKLGIKVVRVWESAFKDIEAVRQVFLALS